MQQGLEIYSLFTLYQGVSLQGSLWSLKSHAQRRSRAYYARSDGPWLYPHGAQTCSRPAGTVAQSYKSGP